MCGVTVKQAGNRDFWKVMSKVDGIGPVKFIKRRGAETVINKCFILVDFFCSFTSAALLNAFFVHLLAVI